MIPDSLSPVANHVWQSTVFACAAGLLTLALRKNAARIRHRIWVVASLKFLVPFSVLIALGAHVPWRKTSASAPVNFPVVLHQVSQPFTVPADSFSAPSATSHSGGLPALLWTLWACGFLSVVFSSWRRWRRVVAAVDAGSPIDVGIFIPAVSSPSFLEPGVFGVFRPVLLLPDGILEQLTPEQWESAVAHELCHVRHRDNLIGAVQMFVETLFWFHPLVWWIGKRICHERERGCDEEVLQLGGDPRIYAQGILKVCELYLESPVACVAGISGSNLRKRIEGILHGRAIRNLNWSRKALIACSAVAALLGPVVVGVTGVRSIRAQEQAADAPEFEVASVKPHELPPGWNSVPTIRGSQLTISGSRVTTTGTLLAFVLEAYNLRTFQVSGSTRLPDKSGNDALYDIEARAPGNGVVSVEQARRMLQSLLTERFQLKFHHESKELPVYYLVAASNTSRLKPSAPDTATKTDVLPTGRGMFHFQYTNVSLSELVIRIASDFDRPLFDRTGLAGGYDFSLEYVHNSDTSKWSPEEKAALEKAGTAGGPSLTSALQQLGLKVVSAKDSVEVLVVDHAERPSEN